MKPYTKIFCFLLLISVKIVLTDKEFPKKVRAVADEERKRFSELINKAKELGVNLEKSNVVADHGKMVSAFEKLVSEDYGEISGIIYNYCKYTLEIKSFMTNAPVLDPESDEFWDLTKSGLKVVVSYLKDSMNRIAEDESAASDITDRVYDNLRKLEGSISITNYLPDSEPLNVKKAEYREWLLGAAGELRELFKAENAVVYNLWNSAFESVDLVKSIEAFLPEIEKQSRDKVIHHAELANSMVQPTIAVCENYANRG